MKDEISTQQVEIPSSTLHFSVDDLKPSMYYQFWVVSNSVSSAGNASIIQGYRVATSRSQLNNDDHIGNNTYNRTLTCIFHTSCIITSFYLVLLCGSGTMNTYYVYVFSKTLKCSPTISGIYSIGHEVKVREGATIHLPCLHTAKSSVEIDWFKDKGQNVRHSEGRSIGRMAIQKSQLEINNVRSQDTGNYSCHVKAWQRDQSDSITYTLIVLSKSIHRCIQCAIHLVTKVTTYTVALLHL